jgi:hypothetical protein
VKSTAKAAGISMQSLASKTSADLFLEEGTAFALLEGRHLFTPRKDENMSSAAEETSDDQHFAPREAWDAIAESYDEYVAPGEAGLATEALRLAGLKPEDSFLDVAAGTGGLTLPAARLGARVIAADWSPKMIERFPMPSHSRTARSTSRDRCSESCSCRNSQPRSAKWFALRKRVGACW